MLVVVVSVHSDFPQTENLFTGYVKVLVPSSLCKLPNTHPSRMCKSGEASFQANPWDPVSNNREFKMSILFMVWRRKRECQKLEQSV